MIKIFMFVLLGVGVVSSSVFAQRAFEKDVLQTTAGDVEITFIGHGTLMLAFDGKIIHIDPFGKLGDYSQLPKADLILLTHAHGDHLDPAALSEIQTDDTTMIIAEVCAAQVKDAISMKNGEIQSVDGLTIEAVPAYNLVHTRDDGQPFHPKGEGNGYIISFGETRVYIAGDTENTPEMKALKDIDCAFLPMNLPYTMTPEMVADASRAFKPAILYPYHYGDTETAELLKLLQEEENIEVRIRKMQ